MSLKVILTPIKTAYNAVKAGGSRTARTIYDNSAVVRKTYQLGKKSSKPVLEMKDIYLDNKDKGKLTAVKTIFKEKGICAPILTGGGVLAGTFLTPVPGAGLVAGIGGYLLGHGIDKGALKIIKFMKNIME